MKALIAALEFSCSSHQWPIRRYEHTPMISQPTSSISRLFATTTVSIAPVNRDNTTKNHVNRTSPCMYPSE